MLRGVAIVDAPAWLTYDPRLNALVAPGHRLAELRTWADAHDVPEQGGVPDELDAPLLDPRDPRPYQREAVDRWRTAGRRGTVVLPTGAGKTLVALLAIDQVSAGACVVAPTRALVAQWFTQLADAFGAERVGAYGEADERCVRQRAGEVVAEVAFGGAMGLVDEDEDVLARGGVFAEALELVDHRDDEPAEVGIEQLLEPGLRVRLLDGDSRTFHLAEEARDPPGELSFELAAHKPQRRAHPRAQRRELRERARILRTMSLPRLRRFLVDPGERATRLRQTLPFLTALTAEERQQLFDAAAASAEASETG